MADDAGFINECIQSEITRRVVRPVTLYGSEGWLPLQTMNTASRYEIENRLI